MYLLFFYLIKKCKKKPIGRVGIKIKTIAGYVELLKPIGRVEFIINVMWLEDKGYSQNANGRAVVVCLIFKFYITISEAHVLQLKKALGIITFLVEFS